LLGRRHVEENREIHMALRNSASLLKLPALAS
jgi:hypothetical protein